jgi:hypothetical protein
LRTNLLKQKTAAPLEIQIWPIDRLVLYARNPRKNDLSGKKATLDGDGRRCPRIPCPAWAICGCVFRQSARCIGFKIPVLARSDSEVVDGHLRIKAARKPSITEIPVILCDEWSPAQVKAFRLMVNRSVTWASWDDEMLALELKELNEEDFDLSLTGFDPGEIDGTTATRSRKARHGSAGRADGGESDATSC